MTVQAKISGFTFIRNGVELGYPFIESIKSLLPIVEEFVIAVGQSSDNTLEQIQALNEPKIRIIETVWNEKMSERGFVYAQQKMIAQYSCVGDWAFYLEGDEVLHEDDLEKIKKAVQNYHDDKRVEAIAFKYLHFYGDAKTYLDSPAWYKTEVRLIRNSIRSYAPDGLFWVIMDKHKKGRMPNAKVCDAHIYHYGYVRHSDYMQQKIDQVSKYWDSETVKFDYGNIDNQTLKPFTGNHPKIVKNWLSREAQSNFTLNPDYKLSTREKKHRLVKKIEKLLSMDLSKKHYHLI
jgi:glycosyltransferase involved in cell wall biosynthesis